tara:strand:- start:5983 stop:6261 length:279 start_codon:yes stop_codon:yes gene_type:complete
MKTQSNKKFWTFKDTKKHKNLNEKYMSLKTVRIFVFDKSYLLQVKCKEDKSIVQYVIPHTFISNEWPFGFYSGISDDGVVHFSDKDIIRVIG